MIEQFKYKGTLFLYNLLGYKEKINKCIEQEKGISMIAYILNLSLLTVKEKQQGNITSSFLVVTVFVISF